MMKQHCDRCLELVENRRSWVEVESKWDPPKKMIIHLNTGLVNNVEQDFCKDCWIEILQKTIEDLR
jgi:hypothetical protein